MNRFSLKAYGAGVLTSGAVLALSALILTMLLCFTDASEGLLPRSGTILQFAAAFLGGLIAAKRARNKGVIYGAAVGATLVLLFVLCRLSVGNGQLLWALTDLLLVAAGIFGAMVGIGLSEQ